MTSEYSESHDPLGHTSGALRVPQDMLRTYSYLRDYVKREMARMLAAEGRGADAHLAHLATGEMVLPRKLLDGDPWLRSYLVRVFEDAGLDWRMNLVGGPNRHNPATGLPEFDAGRDEVSDFENSYDDRGWSGGSGNAGVENRAPTSNLGGGGSNYLTQVLHSNRGNRVGNALLSPPGKSRGLATAPLTDSTNALANAGSLFADGARVGSTDPVGTGRRSAFQPTTEFGLLDGDPYPNYDEESLGRAIRDGIFSRGSSYNQSELEPISEADEARAEQARIQKQRKEMYPVIWWGKKPIAHESAYREFMKLLSRTPGVGFDGWHPDGNLFRDQGPDDDLFRRWRSEDKLF